MLLTIGSLVSVTLLQNLDMIYAKKILSADHAGLFAAWSLLAKIITYVFGPLISISYVYFSNKKDEIHHRIFLLVGLVFLIFVGVATNLGYDYFARFILVSLFGEKFFSLRPFVEWAGLFGSGYLIMIFLNTYFMAKGSKATLILPCTLPIYIGALFFYVKDLGSLILLDTVFIFFVLTLFLIPLFKDRLMKLIK